MAGTLIVDPRRKRLAGLLDEAAVLEKKNELTETELLRAEEIAAEVGPLRKQIRSSAEVAEKLRNLAGVGSFSTDGESAFAAPGGSRVERTKRFSMAVRRAREQKDGLSDGVPSGPYGVEFQGPIVEDPKHQFSLASLVNNATVDVATGTYLRQTVRELNAAPVKIGDLKPESNFGFEKKTWELTTIAHVLKPLAQQWLTDIGGLGAFLNSELAYGLDEATNAYVLNGGVTEAGNTVTGVLNTPGVDTVPYTSDALTTIRTALRTLEDRGVTASGIALGSADWAALELLQDGAGRPYLTALGAQAAERTLWGVPVTVVQGIPAGTAVIADWATVSYFRLNGSTQITSQQTGTYTDDHGNTQDLYTHNLVRVRAEWRAGIAITSLPSIVKVALAQPAAG